MMSISTTRETYFGRGASEPTGRTPTAWVAGRGDEAQSATFRALAWSQDDDSVAEPLPYIGEQSQEFTAFEADAAEPPSATPDRRSTLLYGMAAGFVAAAIGGLLLTVVNTDDGPTTISTKVTQPATNAVNSQPKSEAARQEGPIRQSVPGPAKTAAAPPRTVPSATAPRPAIAAPAVGTQTRSTPEAAAPEAPAPEVTAPEAPEPEVNAPEANPPVWVPPALSSPVVSVPQVTPQQVPHPVGPADFDLPMDFHVPTVADPPIAWPAAPAAPDPVLTLDPGVIPTFSIAAGR